MREIDQAITDHGIRPGLLHAFEAEFGELRRNYGGFIGGGNSYTTLIRNQRIEQDSLTRRKLQGDSSIEEDALESLASRHQRQLDNFEWGKFEGALDAFRLDLIDLNNEVAKYIAHGFVRTLIWVTKSSVRPQVVIDLNPLQGQAPPRFAWATLKPEEIRVFISANQPNSRQNHVITFDQIRSQEGLVVKIDQKGFSHKDVPYDVELKPLYTPQARP